MEKETAVEWFFENLPTFEKHDNFYAGLLKKAKEMEKQQIVDAWVDGNDNEPKEITNDFAEKYYNKQFKK